MACLGILAKGGSMIDISKALTVQGWMTESELTYLAEMASKWNDAPFDANIVEVGSWMGRSTCALASNTNGRVWAVDTWQGSPEHAEELAQHEANWLYSQFLHNVTGLPVMPVMLPSVWAAEWLKRCQVYPNLVFLDANHTYESVKADIEAWLPLIDRGGILCGHDYDPPNWMGVHDAVNECVPGFKVVPGTTIWYAEVA
jgi:hypothetical protein